MHEFIRNGLRWMGFAMRPYPVVPGYELTRLKRGGETSRSAHGERSSPASTRAAAGKAINAAAALTAGTLTARR